MSPLKTIRTVKMAWHNGGKRSGTNVENLLALKELKKWQNLKSLHKIYLSSLMDTLISSLRE